MHRMSQGRIITAGEEEVNAAYAPARAKTRGGAECAACPNAAAAAGQGPGTASTGARRTAGCSGVTRSMLGTPAGS